MKTSHDPGNQAMTFSKEVGSHLLSFDENEKEASILIGVHGGANHKVLSK